MIESSVRGVLQHLRERPGMVLGPDKNSVSSYTQFLNGFFLGIEICHPGLNIEREISSWYQPRVTVQGPNMVWFEQFKMINKDKSEVEQIALLLSEISSFFDDTDFFHRFN